MYSKEDIQELKKQFWSGFRRYCGKNHIYRKWVLTGVKIQSTQLKFHVDKEKALVLFQIDHKSSVRRKEIFGCFLAYRKLWAAECGEDLLWAEDFDGVGERTVSAIYFELLHVNINNQNDWKAIYTFFASKMILLEDTYWDYKDLLTERIKHQEDYE